jgi:hypothetical protein
MALWKGQQGKATMMTGFCILLILAIAASGYALYVLGGLK